MKNAAAILLLSFLALCLLIHVVTTAMQGAWLMLIGGVVVFPVGIVHGFAILIGWF